MTNLATLTLPSYSMPRLAPINNNGLLSWQLRQASNMICASLILGLIYPIFDDGFGSIIPYINGFLIGTTGGLGLALGELVLFKTIRKKVSFLEVVLLKILFYTTMIAFITFTEILISRSFQYGLTIKETIESSVFHDFLFRGEFAEIIVYALLLTSLVIFTREISRKMGQGVLFNFILGRYFRPRKEKRIFMFLDMTSSVSKAETLGDMEYHNLLNDFFCDITDCILMSGGRIHQYVGDEVVVSWPVRKNTNTENCLLAYFNSVEKIQVLRRRYETKYNVVPHFKAAFHYGEVIYGEIGEIKSEIVFHGDTMNTTARLERMCSELKEDVLLSKVLYDTFSPDVKKLFRSAGNIKLRGKEQRMEIFGLSARPV